MNMTANVVVPQSIVVKIKPNDKEARAKSPTPFHFPAARSRASSSLFRGLGATRRFRRNVTFPPSVLSPLREAQLHAAPSLRDTPRPGAHPNLIRSIPIRGNAQPVDRQPGVVAASGLS